MKIRDIILDLEDVTQLLSDLSKYVSENCDAEEIASICFSLGGIDNRIGQIWADLDGFEDVELGLTGEDE